MSRDAWAVYAHSHWQGSGPDHVVAIGSRKACERFEALMSTCSFCSPGRTANYSVGTCYHAREPKYVPRKAPELPAEAPEWDRADFAAWLDDALVDDGS